MTTFNELFKAKVFPKLTEGLNVMILKGFGSPVETTNSKKEPTSYIPVKLGIVWSGRIVTYNVFADQFQGRFLSPIQSQINPENDRQWESAEELFNEIIANKTPLNCWIERVTYLSATGERTTMNFNFSEPKVKPVTTQSTEENLEEIPF